MALKTGIEKLDKLLKGGFPEKSVILIKGSPGVGKDVLCLHFLFNCVNEKDNTCYYAFTEKNNEEVEAEFKSYGMDISKAVEKKNIFWIDASNMCKGKNVINCKLDELFTVSLAVKQVLEGNKKQIVRGVFNILSPALMTNEPIIIYKFMADLIDTLKQHNTCTVFLIEDGMHSPDTVTAMEQLCDCVIEMKMKEEGIVIKRLLGIKKMKGVPPDSKYHEFEIKEKGIVILD